MSRANNSVETVNAAATAIISAESRVQQITLPVRSDQPVKTHANCLAKGLTRRRWGACFGAYWCFGSQRHNKRISHAVLVPEPTLPGSNAPVPENPTHPPVLLLPFVAPPSSPASFFQSEPPSATQSPVGVISLSALSANAYSPSGPASIFAIGPYAHETQLVSPPVFSTFTTEPSTASFTPPPEPVHLTTPSSPEVPFAQLLTSSLNSNCRKGEVYEFPSYQLYPGSPIGHLISPSSVCSGTSSPFPDLEAHSSSASFLPKFPNGEPPKILSAEDLAVRKLVPRYPSRDVGSLLNGQIPATVTKAHSDEPVVDHRVSFELTAEVARCIEKKQTISCEGTQEPSVLPAAATAEKSQYLEEAGSGAALCVDENYHDLPQRSRTSISLAALKEFKFDNSDGTSAEPSVGSDWWANEKVSGVETSPCKNWAFFPMMQPGVS